MRTTTAPVTIIAVKKALKTGAVDHPFPTPDSHPKALHTTYAVESGRMQAARNDAARRPTPNSALA
jgi:hypothetical protein